MLQPDFILQAFAEELHERIRKELWGYSCRENMEANDLHKIKYQVRYEPFNVKTCLQCFLPGLTQTGLCSHTRWLEYLNFKFRKQKDCSCIPDGKKQVNSRFWSRLEILV